MADFKRQQFEIGLEFVRHSKPKKDMQVIRVLRAGAPRVFLTQITCFDARKITTETWKISLALFGKNQRFHSQAATFT